MPSLIASQSLQFEEPRWAIPTTTNNAVYQDMSQKFHILKSCSRKSTPKTKKDTPPIIIHFLQTHIYITSFNIYSKCLNTFWLRIL